MMQQARSSPIAVDSDESAPLDNKATRHDWLTVAALSLFAMSVVTCDHETLGHGGTCLALGGHLRILTSSVFRCD